MLIIGHRGAKDKAPENTIKSFVRAFDDGADAIELDVRRCKGDDPLAVIHDGTVDRTTNGKGRVKRLTMVELKKLDAGEGAQIPSLPEVLESKQIVGRGKVFIEIKSRQIAADVAELITEQVQAGRWIYDDLIVICFQHDILARVRAIDPKILLGLHLVSNDGEEKLAKFSVDSAVLDTQNAIEAYRPNYILPCMNVLSKEMVDTARAKKVQVLTWTAKTKEDVQKAVESGADAVASDDPALAKSYL